MEFAAASALGLLLPRTGTKRILLLAVLMVPLVVDE